MQMDKYIKINKSINTNSEVKKNEINKIKIEHMSHIFLIFIIKFFPLKKKIKLKYKKLKCFFYSLNLFNKFIPKLVFINLPHHLKETEKREK